MNQNTHLPSESSTTTRIRYFDQFGVVESDGEVRSATGSRVVNELIEYPEIPGGKTPSELIAEMTASNPELEGLLQDARQELAEDYADILPPIKQLRLKAGMSQQELALALDCSQPNVARMESSRGSDMQISTVKRVAEALGADPRVLFDMLSKD